MKKGFGLKILSLLVVIIVVTGLVAGCSSGGNQASSSSQATSDTKSVDTSQNSGTTQASSNVTLSFMTNMTGASSDAVAQVCKDFTAKTGIKVDYSTSENYEALMKTKMASGDLLDLWATHGWSIARYSTFLRPLNDQPWFGNISPSIKPQITDKNGNVYCLPIDQDMSGIVYNADVLQQCGINVDDLTTVGKFEAAMQTIKQHNIVPFAMGNKDTWTMGQFGVWWGQPLYISDDNNNQRAAFLNGTFDWNNWSLMLNMIQKWQKNGYFNPDVLTSDYATIVAQLGQGKVAFEPFGNYAIIDAKKANSSAHIGFMPIPAYYSGDKPTLLSGEHLAIGVWKDTTKMNEALQFLSYLATPEVSSKLSTVCSMLPGLTGAKADLGDIQQYYDKYTNAKTLPYFDRIYLPSGMYDDMALTAANVLAGKPIADQITYLANSYKTKLSQTSN